MRYIKAAAVWLVLVLGYGISVAGFALVIPGAMLYHIGGRLDHAAGAALDAADKEANNV